MYDTLCPAINVCMRMRVHLALLGMVCHQLEIGIIGGFDADENKKTGSTCAWGFQWGFPIAVRQA
jgi:hypothetical protein